MEKQKEKPTEKQLRGYLEAKLNAMRQNRGIVTPDRYMTDNKGKRVRGARKNVIVKPKEEYLANPEKRPEK